MKQTKTNVSKNKTIIKGATEKRGAKDGVRTNKTKNTISKLVLSTFKVNPTIGSKEMIELVKKSFPDSKFNVYHYSWYRYQIKSGRYNKLFDKNQLSKIFVKQ